MYMYSGNAVDNSLTRVNMGADVCSDIVDKVIQWLGYILWMPMNMLKTQLFKTLQVNYLYSLDVEQ